MADTTGVDDGTGEVDRAGGGGGAGRRVGGAGGSAGGGAGRTVAGAGGSAGGGADGPVAPVAGPAGEDAAGSAGGGRGIGGRIVAGLRVYGLVAGMWMRSTMAYRTSFALTTLGNFATTALDFVAILLMFSRVDALGGFSLAEVAFLYGLSGLSFGLADLAVGSMDRLGARVRDGTLDTLLVRPAPVLAQVAADRFGLRRVGRVAQGSLVLGWALARVDVDWTAAKLLLMPVMVLSGAGIFCAVFVAAAAFQFVAQDASEVSNAFTYGGTTMLQYPPTVFARELVQGVTFVVPLAFVNWLPACYVLGRPYPLDLPGWVAFTSPLVAAACGVPAGLAWRAALRSYRSTGS